MKTKRQILILFFFIGAIILHHFFGYIGHFGYDDLHYAKLAHDFKNGVIDFNDHFSFRSTIIAFTALSYSIFGVSDFASSFPSIIISIIILLIVYKILSVKGNKALIIGLALTTFSNWFIFYSDKLMPDIYIVLSVIGSLYVIHEYRYRDINNNVLAFSLLLGFSLLFGFLSKGTIVLIVPLLLYYFILDIIRKQHIKFWIYTILCGVAMLSIYFFIIWLLTGDFLKRFDSISSNSYLNLCSYDKQSFQILIKRIAYQFFHMIIYQGMATGFIFVLAYLLSSKSFRVFKLEDSFSFWITSSFILLLSSNFMSISLTSYSPMCLDIRHYLFMVPVVSISASSVIVNFIERKDLKIQIIVILAVIAVVAYFSQGNSFLHLYLPLFILFLCYLFIKSNPRNQNVFIILLIIILSIRLISMFNYAQKIEYRQQKQIFKTQILENNDSSVIITNDVQKRLGNYYNDFRDDGNINILEYEEFNYDSTDNRKYLLFKNWYTRYLSNLEVHDLPYYAQNVTSENELLYQNEDLNIAVYQMHNFTIPEKNGKTLLHSINNFEENIPFWNQTSDNISDEVKYEGNFSYRVSEFSSTFEFNTDTLDLDNVSQLYIKSSAYCYFTERTDAKLIISIENEEGVYMWEDIEVNKYIKAFSNWWLIKHELNVSKSALKENSKIKVYLWNVAKQEAYVDNFQVEIIGYLN